MNRPVAPTVLSAPLARTDRRALSQAWYDALHVAHERPRTHAAPRAPQPAAAAAPRSPAPRVARTAGATAGAARAVRAARSGPLCGAPPGERRTVACALARRLEHAVLRAAQRPVPSSFTLAFAGGRVRILIRRHRDRTHVVAICAPVMRERVERALAHARFALAARGMRTGAAA